MYKYLFLSFTCLLLFACSSGGGDSLVPGYDTTVYDRPGGAEIALGNYVEFDLDILSDGGEVLQSLRTQPQKPIMYLPLEEENKPLNPLQTLLSNAQDGDSLALFIPKDSMPDPAPIMGENAFLEYRIKVRQVFDKAEYEAIREKEQAAAALVAQELQAKEAGEKEAAQKLLKDYLAGKNIGETKSLDNGLTYAIVNPGTGAKAAPGQTVEVSYIGMLSDGTVFDNSFRAGRNFSFGIGRGQVIQGWDTGIAELPVGTKALLDIPPAIGYGERGSPPAIPANADLYFLVEVFSVK